MPALGRLPAVDERDRNFPMRARLPQLLPAGSKFWVTGPVLDQGSLPHCVGYAWNGWMTASPTRTKDGPSGPTIYAAAQLVDEWPGEAYEGTSVRAGAKVLEGQSRIVEYVWAQNVEELINWIVQKGSVVVGTNWYEKMFTPDVGGYVEPTGPLAGGHAYLINGFSITRMAFRCLNSWGTGWGQKGRFWIRDEHLQRLLFGENGEACAAIETKPGV